MSKKLVNFNNCIAYDFCVFLQQIGDSFRGWVETEVELDLVLTFHKQQTMSFWGTRQSPSPAKQSTRLMWKSQYVPFDGIPFINAGNFSYLTSMQVTSATLHQCR